MDTEPALILTERQLFMTCFWRWLQGVVFGIGLGLALAFGAYIYKEKTSGDSASRQSESKQNGDANAKALPRERGTPGGGRDRPR